MNRTHRAAFLPRVHENRSHMVNAKTSVDSPVCTPPSVTTITTATIAATTVWWAAMDYFLCVLHFTHPLCVLLYHPVHLHPWLQLKHNTKSSKERLSQKTLLCKIRYWIQNNWKFCKLNTWFRIHQVFVHRNLRRRVIPM